MSCDKTINLRHADDGPIPVGPARLGSSNPNDSVTHYCSCGSRPHVTHYCGCGVDWDDLGIVTRAPWLEENTRGGPAQQK